MKTDTKLTSCGLETWSLSWCWRPTWMYTKNLFNVMIEVRISHRQTSCYASVLLCGTSTTCSPPSPNFDTQAVWLKSTGQNGHPFISVIAGSKLIRIQGNSDYFGASVYEDLPWCYLLPKLHALLQLGNLKNICHLRFSVLIVQYHMLREPIISSAGPRLSPSHRQALS